MNFSGKLTYKVIIKDDYVRADGTSALYIQVFLNKQQKRFPLNISVKPENFDKIKQRIKAKTTFATDYNILIEKSLSEISKIELNYRLLSVQLTMDKLVNEFTNPSCRLDFCNFWTNEMETQKMKLKQGSYRQQVTVLNKLKAFRNVIYFYEIDLELVDKLNYYLKSVLKNNDNTIASFWKSFKKYLHLANKKGIITPLMHSEIKRGEFTSDRVFLMPNEIRKLFSYYNSEFIIATHKAILARFLFSCFTGLRISDVTNLTNDNIIENTLAFTAVKTSKFQRISLNDSAKKYLDPKLIFKAAYTGEYINRELKNIAKICGIRKVVTYHVARHTFATNFLICGGRVENLQKILGHSKITDTMIYVHIVESITDIQIHNMDEILIKKPLD